MRAQLAFVSLVLVGCETTLVGPQPAPAESPPALQTDELRVDLSLGAGTVRLLATRAVAVAEESSSAMSDAALRYELVDEQGVAVAQGALPDTRVVRGEWTEGGQLRGATVLRSEGLASAKIPAIDGDLVIYDGTTEIGRVFVSGAGPTPQPLEVLGSPVVVHDGGPPETALDILIVGDGYTGGEMAAFASDADAHVAALFRDPDFQAYSGRITVRRLDVASPESGVDENGAVRDTAFDVARHQTTERLLYISTAEGQARAEELRRRHAADQVVVIGNTSGYGGSGGLIAVAASVSPDVLGHEIGHSLLGLADEYDYGSCDTPVTGAPNVATSAALESLPWADLVAGGTQLPTPDAVGPGVVGAFEGAAYCPTGRYRPEHDCLMRGLGQPMCDVCRRELDRYFAALGGGGGSDGGDGGGSDSDGGGDSGDGSTTCEYRCDDYGYAPGQCYEGWQCDGECLVYVETCEEAPPAACEYLCADYGYTSGQCHEGWQCDGECLIYVDTCEEAAPACEYQCTDYGYTPGQCYEGWQCDGECLAYVGAC